MPTTHKQTVYNPSRAIVGLCPSCSAVCVVLNDHETWPLVTCPCDWQGATTELEKHVYLERGRVEMSVSR